MSIQYKRGITQHKSLNCYKVIGSLCSKIYVYHYMSLEAFFNSFDIEDMHVRFSQPSTWNDMFEKRFYNADYVTKLHAVPSTHPSLFAFCNTACQNSEPGWRMYAKGVNNTIQLKINHKEWRKVINRFAFDNGYSAYEGTAFYGIKEAHLARLHQTTYTRGSKSYPVAGHNTLFSNFDLESYLNLLLMKRDAFEYEHEIRYFIIPNQEPVKNHCLIPINWKNVVKEIRYHPNIGMEDFNKLKNIVDNIWGNHGILMPYDVEKGKYADFTQPIIVEK